MIKIADVKSAAGSVMTDGCGLMHEDLRLGIRGHLRITELPCFFQARIGGFKGIWAVLPDADWPYGDFRLAVRVSMRVVIPSGDVFSQTMTAA